MRRRRWPAGRPNEQAPEEARVAALLILRKAGAPAPALRPMLEKAVRPEASPRLRAAALPLYARLIDPEQAEEIARSEMKGPPAARAAGAAVWGTVAMSRPELATTPLKSCFTIQRPRCASKRRDRSPI